jgi:hypothetical protein
MALMEAPFASSSTERVAVLGDVHGHLQLALCMLARWQRELNIQLDAVFLVGDVGTFTDSSQFDEATRRHARGNPCELEFLLQWSTWPAAPWLAKIFDGTDGLGLGCPVVMVHGNHEGFDHLRTLVPSRRPTQPVDMSDLPTVDTDGFIRYLPSGWRTTTAAGFVVGGIGGMEAGQPLVKYHPMAFIDDNAVEMLLRDGPVDILLTHQGPSLVQGTGGSPTLDRLSMKASHVPGFMVIPRRTLRSSMLAPACSPKLCRSVISPFAAAAKAGTIRGKRGGRLPVFRTMPFWSTAKRRRSGATIACLIGSTATTVDLYARI